MSVFVVYGGCRCNEDILQSYLQCIYKDEDKAKETVKELNNDNKKYYNEYWYEEEEVIE